MRPNRPEVLYYCALGSKGANRVQAFRASTWSVSIRGGGEEEGGVLVWGSWMASPHLPLLSAAASQLSYIYYKLQSLQSGQSTPCTA